VENTTVLLYGALSGALPALAADQIAVPSRRGQLCGQWHCCGADYQQQMRSPRYEHEHSRQAGCCKAGVELDSNSQEAFFWLIQLQKNSCMTLWANTRLSEKSDFLV